MKKLQAWLISPQAISEKGPTSELIYLITTSQKVPVSFVEWEVLKGRQSTGALSVLLMDKSMYDCMLCPVLTSGIKE